MSKKIKNPNNLFIYEKFESLKVEMEQKGKSNLALVYGRVTIN